MPPDINNEIKLKSKNVTDKTGRCITIIEESMALDIAVKIPQEYS